MPPVTALEKSKANKRKRDFDERGKRKRKKTEALKQQQLSEDGSTSREPPAVAQVNGHASHRKTEHRVSSPVDSGRVVKRDQSKPHDQSKQKRLVRGLNSAWSISNPMGGRILDIDPILTENEQFLILAYNTSIQIYSATDSLLVRKIYLNVSRKQNSRGQIASIALSSTSPYLVWVASCDGLVWLIDWTTGDGSFSPLPLGCEFLQDIFIGSIEIGEAIQDVLFASVGSHDEWHIIAYDIQDNTIESLKPLFTSTSVIQHLRSTHSGLVMAASSGRNILLGSMRTGRLTSFHDLSYEFYTMESNDDITCLDLRVSDRIHLSWKSENETGTTPVADVVVGCARGAVFFYNDLLPQLRPSRSSKRKYSLQPRKYHWHRRAVHAVKWSRDGNYIISGGSESTLVLWQLDTQKLDFLPHLSATIENIVVSARGSSYILHLDDNSAMILSTAELKPTTYVSGIQALLNPPPFSKDDVVRRVGQHTPNRLLETPAVIDPSQPSQILVCVGNGQHPSHSGAGPSTPLIQRLDLTTMQSISKQALTRTNPTDVNTTAKGYTITEPRVTGMAYSHDGRWLATTDEWQPPARDVRSIDGTSSERREVYLKFWSLSVKDKSSKKKTAKAKTADDGDGEDKTLEQQTFELATRINAPHRTEHSESVYHVTADPKRDRFATIGEDGILRFWEPTIRQRDGVLIKGKQGRQLHSWACSKAIYLRGNDAAVDPELPTGPVGGSGALWFSEDGSVLVCALVYEYVSSIYVVDTESGKIRNTIGGLISGDIQGIGILSTYLVVLSDTLMVYDMVLDELRYGIQLRTNLETHGPGASILAHLCIDYESNRFAVAVSRNKTERASFRSELAIFNTDLVEPEVTSKFPFPITSVLSLIGSSGFLVLDSAAQLWSISEDVQSNLLPFAQPLADLNLEGKGETDQEAEAPQADAALALLAEGDDESVSGDEMDVDKTEGGLESDGIYPAVVPPQRLAELFDAAPSFAMPPIEDMFYQVAHLFSAKGPVSVT